MNKEQKIKFIDKCNNNESYFTKNEAKNLYSIEREFLIPIVKQTASFSLLATELLTLKPTLSSVKKVLKPLIDNFFLNEIKFKVTVNKKGRSYSSIHKKAIFINRTYIDDLKYDHTLESAQNILRVAIHELAHSYTNGYFCEHAQHNSTYFYNLMKLYEFVSEISITQFLFSKNRNNLSLQEQLEKQSFLFSEWSYIHYKVFKNEKEVENFINLIKDENTTVIKDSFNIDGFDNDYFVSINKEDSFFPYHYQFFKRNNFFIMTHIDYEQHYKLEKAQQQKYIN